MAEPVAWYEDVLGMKLVKTLDLPNGRGQHVFMDMGNGVDAIAFFWFPDAPEGVRGESLQDRNGTLLEFACWTRALDDRDVQHAPATARVETGAR
jgi:catechol 2,3-dioxygenase-like lactoylglutathione lyase family enzyme